MEKISLRDEVSQSSKALELIERALEMEEDEYFSKIAEARDKPNAKFLSHEEAWGL
ncbi:hypothetical protein HY285_03015 [Candidatus Peregrinibacteria bacterium]|nr:hypothetical protein [Candidatus Peregrinibacteria bacterium]MBI3816487.1 hypothetical protein [Candidatus Peregrinibacteria bacterium]